MKNKRYTTEQRSRGGKNKPKRETTYEEILARFHDDRKGYVIASGTTYTSKGQSTWTIRHSTKHCQQFDVIQNGSLIRRGGKRVLPAKWIRKKAKEASEKNTNYTAIGLDIL